MAGTYEIRIAGVLSAELLDTFTPIRAGVADGETCFACDVRDDAELFGLIGRIEGLGLTLVGLRRVREGEAESCDASA